MASSRINSVSVGVVWVAVMLTAVVTIGAMATWRAFLPRLPVVQQTAPELGYQHAVQLVRHAAEARALDRVNEGSEAWLNHLVRKQRAPFFIVTAPESGGNRYVASLLLAAGCQGSVEHAQPFDVDHSQRGWPSLLRYDAEVAHRYRDAPCLVVFRSVPHDGELPALARLVAQVERLEFEPRVLVVLRAEPAAAQSQRASSHVDSTYSALQAVVRAQHHIVQQLEAVPDLWYRFVHYGELYRDEYVQWLLAECGLHAPSAWPPFDAQRDNARWKEFYAHDQ